MIGQSLGEPVDVGLPLRQYEAVPTAAEGLDHIADDLFEASGVGGEVAVDGRHPARGSGICGPLVAVASLMHHEATLWATLAGKLGDLPLGCRLGCDGVPDRAELQGNQVVEAVTTVRGGGQSEPTASRDLLDDVLEGCRRDVVALVDHDEPVSGSQLGDVVAPGEGLQHRHVHDPSPPGAPPSELTGLDSQEDEDLGSPLVGQCLAIHEHQG